MCKTTCKAAPREIQAVV